MTTVIVGPGAVGGFIAAHLNRAGAPVMLVGREPRVGAISRDGLRLIGPEKSDVRYRCPITTNMSVVGTAQAVIVAVKSYHTAEVAGALKRHIGKGPVVLVQNGVEGARRFSEIIGAPVLSGVAFLCAQAEAPNIVRHHGGGELVIGPDGGEARSVVAMLEQAGLRSRADPEIERVMWSKLAANCGVNALSALTRMTYRQLLTSPGLLSACLGAVDEVVDLGAACGVSLERDVLRKSTIELMRAMESGKSSMATDLAGRRETEIDALNGFVARAGILHGVRTPVNSLLSALVKAAQERRSQTGAPVLH